VHAATTVGDPPLPCVLCNASLPDREALCAHIVKHSDDLANEVRAASKVTAAAETPKGRRGPRRSSAKVLLQAADGKYVAVEKEHLPIAATRRAPATATASDDSSRSTPGSPFPGNFPKMEPMSSQVDLAPSATPQGSSKGESSGEETLPIPGFSEIAPTKELAPNVSVADMAGPNYNFVNRDGSLPSSMDNDMIDPMAFMQVVTDIQPDQDAANRLSGGEQSKEGSADEEP